MKSKVMTVKQVEYHDLEEHIRQVYGLEDPKERFSVIAMEEWRNDSQHSFCMKKEPLDTYDQKALDRWKAAPLEFPRLSLRVILQDMVNNGYLGEGNYLITV